MSGCARCGDAVVDYVPLRPEWKRYLGVSGDTRLVPLCGECADLVELLADRWTQRDRFPEARAAEIEANVHELLDELDVDAIVEG